MYYIIILNITIIDFYLSRLKWSVVSLMKICPLPAVAHQEAGECQGDQAQEKTKCTAALKFLMSEIRSQ